MWGYSALRSIYTLKGTLCGAVRPTLKQTLKETRSTCFCSDRSCRSDSVWTCHTIPYTNIPLSFYSLSPRLSGSIFHPALERLPLLYSCVIPSRPSDSPSRCRGTAACAHCILSDIFSITAIKQTAEPNQKLQVYSAAGCRQRWCQRLTSPSNVRLQWIGASNVVITAPDHWQK